jgi:uncharacterized membrane protein YphA (DoxX/SURF4 family)
MSHLLRSAAERMAPTALLLVRLSFGCIFLSSSLPKLRQPHEFLGKVYNYQLVGPDLGVLVAMALPWLELIVGICLLAGIFVGGALLVIVGMAVMFTSAVGVALYRGLTISCGCFGTSASEMVSYVTLIRAIAILLVSAGAYATVVLRQPKGSEPAKILSPVAVPS